MPVSTLIPWCQRPWAETRRRRWTHATIRPKLVRHQPLLELFRIPVPQFPQTRHPVHHDDHHGDFIIHLPTFFRVWFVDLRLRHEFVYEGLELLGSVFGGENAVSSQVDYSSSDCHPEFPTVIVFQLIDNIQLRECACSTVSLSL